MMKRSIVGVALGALLVSGVAYAQVKDMKPPANAATPEGVSISDLSVGATCGQTANVNVTISHSLKAPTRVVLWGSAGEHFVDLPSGKGTKLVTLPGAKLDCNSEASIRDALNQVVYLGDRGGRVVTFVESESTKGAPIQ